MTLTPELPSGVAWGSIASYNWNGDFGYWFDAVGVRAQQGSAAEHVCAHMRHALGRQACSTTCPFWLWLQVCHPRHIALSREVLRGTRTFCTVQVDFVDLPPQHRVMPVWETTHNEVRALAHRRVQ